MPSPLTILALNASTQDAAFDVVRSIDPGIAVQHAAYRTSWEEVSARRTGAPSPLPEELSDELRAALARAEVIFAFVVPRDLRTLAPRLRWLATPATGIDHLRGTGILEADNVLVTTVGGLFAPVIAEHVLLGMLHFTKHAAQFAAQQRARQWKMLRVESLDGRSVGVVGVGSIGTAVARLAHAFGMHVTGLGRRPAADRRVPDVDRLLSRDELPQLLASADYVVLAVADTPDTRHMIGRVELAMMRPDAVLINVARGTVVDEAALIEALQARRIAGAVLDVFAQEPLPTDSPLWHLPHVLLTPHVAAYVTDYLPRAVVQFADNVRRFLQGQPLVNRLDRARGY